MMATVFGYDSLFLGHSGMYNTIVGICNIINLDVDFVSPSCLLSAGEIWKYVRMSTLLPPAHGRFDSAGAGMSMATTCCSSSHSSLSRSLSRLVCWRGCGFVR